MRKIKEILEEVKNSDFKDQLAAEVLLIYVLGLSREDLFMKMEEEIDEKTKSVFWKYFDELKKGRPLAQIIGHKEFYGLDFTVDENVLIPRPESEMVVDIAREFIKNSLAQSNQVRVVDIGTGSGNIILALAKTEPKVRGIGIEISPQALEVAKKNRQQFKLANRVELSKGDLLNDIQEPAEIILANLPYIGTEKFNFVAKNVEEFEPAVALFGGPDGLDLYRKLFQQIKSLKIFPKLIIGEFGFGQNEVMENLLNEYFKNYNWEIIPDLAGIPRVFVIKSSAKS